MLEIIGRTTKKQRKIMSEQKQQAQPAVAPTQAEPAIVSREKLLEAGTYFGHRVSQ
jgi:hypothetical protein